MFGEKVRRFEGFHYGFAVMALMALVAGACVADSDQATPTHVQGEIVGEVTTDSAILQSRLTVGSYSFVPPEESLWAPDVPGSPGVARFEIATTPDFNDSFATEWLSAVPETDFVVKTRVTGLESGTRYYYRLQYGSNTDEIESGPRRTFETLDGRDVASQVSFVVVTGMNFAPFRHLYDGEDKRLGYVTLETILGMQPDFFVATGDNVYYDIPSMQSNVPERLRRRPAQSQEELRKKWHEQLVQPRFGKLFAEVPTYWEKDDHDFRYNDCDTTTDTEPSSELGIETFLEQVPIVDPKDPAPLTYRTHRVNRLLQIWLTEGRDYRSPNMMENGPKKTMWGIEQREWLKRTLLESDATFKILISPTPLIGPDDITKQGASGELDDDFKRDNQAGPYGYSYERDDFFTWLLANDLPAKGFLIVCGDRHWQYHSISPRGIEEFSSGALIDENSRLGRLPGDPESNDPEARIRQPYTQGERSGGFLRVAVTPAAGARPATLELAFFDEHGEKLYSVEKLAGSWWSPLPSELKVGGAVIPRPR